MHNLIVEGIELVGKSYFIHDLWNAIENENNSGQGILDGCIWINTDVGLYGTQDGWQLIDKNVELAKVLTHRNIIFEKLHLTQHLYTQQKQKELFKRYDDILLSLGFKVIVLTIDEDESLIEKRLKERLQSNQSYKRIAKDPSWYLEKQAGLLEIASKTSLPVLKLNSLIIPHTLYKDALDWINN
ncbi:hypothetical protein CO180_00340 [candidate division WWE3 bacterium CG_4_9_14_3_um_filter_41_6]|uniref:Uncharacterized protein n=1 Tax=candidate division WWE3 bacterium CG_4_10_14_0_2_um_filter_41_14 TaxID=1975072 RepID=A0A2M7TKT2_UNCKA|nr:MAG: hypothetical protein COY32_01810 [candidate division WWE3 bacterium CG_4_10_14_0_2_um_filter_41_14]PJA39594.1 MAG: hypothetical protein CO180_00340 [candidate division WWE3 bacterium CG_4_9_14_3_um_filter_41_6]